MAPPRTSYKSAPLAVDLFAGVGGFSLGIEAAGFEVALAVDVDSHTVATYQQNFPSAYVLCADIAQLGAEQIKHHISAYAATTDRSWDGQVALLFGGPPCQGISRIGKRNPSDPRNELIAHFCRLVVELQPVAFVFENVPDLLLPKFAELVEPHIQQLHEAGYKTWSWTLNAKNYGVPQSRKRVFLGGIITSSVPSLPTPSSHAVTVFDALRDLPSLSLEANPELLTSDKVLLCPQQLQQFKEEPNDYVRSLEDIFPPRFPWNKNVLTGCGLTHHSPQVIERFAATHLGTVEPKSRLYRLSWDGVSRTLRAGTGSDRGSHTAARPIHPDSPRVITVREAARLSSFPDWFKFFPNKWHGFRQVGNAVPPLLGRAVGLSVLELLKMSSSKHLLHSIQPIIAQKVLPQNNLVASPRETPDKTGQPSYNTDNCIPKQITQKGCPVLSRKVGTHTLKPHPRNSVIYGEDYDVTELVESIRASRWVKPLVVAQSGTIISGHRRWRAALKLGLETVPVEYREFPNETAELEALLLENDSRDKTTEQKVREALAWEEIEKHKARQRQIELAGTRTKDLRVNLPQGDEEEKGRVRDIVAFRVGLKGSTYERAAKVIKAIDDALTQGDIRTAQALGKVLNSESVHAAHKLLLNPERDVILEKIATGSAKDTKQASKSTKTGKKPEIAHHLKLHEGGLVEINLLQGRWGRAAAIHESTIEVWMRAVETMMMMKRSFKHNEVEPLPPDKEPQPDVRSRIAALFDAGGLTPIEVDFLELLKRPINYAPEELDYLAEIERRHAQRLVKTNIELPLMSAEQMDVHSRVQRLREHGIKESIAHTVLETIEKEQYCLTPVTGGMLGVLELQYGSKPTLLS